MSKRNLPAATVAARPGIETGVAPKVFDRWNRGLKSSAEDDDNSISVLDVIGENWFGEGVTAKRIAAALRKIGARDVVVNINSPGGDFFEGLAIYNTLREHPHKVTVKILGIAASAASVIAMAGDEVRIARAGFLMIHNTWTCACGDQHTFREVADWLEPFDAMAADIYGVRTGQADKDLRAMLNKETWIGGKEAVDQGFADDLLESDDVKEDVGNLVDDRAVKAIQKLDGYLAQLNVPRSERRALVKDVKDGTQDAARQSMHDAALTREVEGLLTTIRNL